MRGNAIENSNGPLQQYVRPHQVTLSPEEVTDLARDLSRRAALWGGGSGNPRNDEQTMKVFIQTRVEAHNAAGPDVERAKAALLQAKAESFAAGRNPLVTKEQIACRIAGLEAAVIQAQKREAATNQELTSFGKDGVHEAEFDAVSVSLSESE